MTISPLLSVPWSHSRRDSGWIGSQGEYNFMVMDLLGPSLDAYFKHCYLVATCTGWHSCENEGKWAARKKLDDEFILILEMTQKSVLQKLRYVEDEQCGPSRDIGDESVRMFRCSLNLYNQYGWFLTHTYGVCASMCMIRTMYIIYIYNWYWYKNDDDNDNNYDDNDNDNSGNDDSNDNNDNSDNNNNNNEQ